MEHGYYDPIALLTFRTVRGFVDSYHHSTFVIAGEGVEPSTPFWL